ncbi:MAG: butyrate kinase [Oscillospiraceae bacterium]|jgi:butyrate kinase|nr:butyrate kinase [Oscillospiraceae bacterium]
MKKVYRILAINPGSTSTKIALFENETELFREKLSHSSKELAPFPDVQSQIAFRTEIVGCELARRGISPSELDVFVGRGGGLLPLEGGVYRVTELLAEHASRGMSGEHPAQLAAQICKMFANEYSKPAFVVNPPDVDEFEDISRITGLRGVYRESHIHALNQKEVALRFCAARGLDYGAVNLIVCHLGGGISITAHKNGRMTDSNDIIRGSGPMTPTRAGDLHYMAVLELAEDGPASKKLLAERLSRRGGLIDHFGTSDAREVRKLIEGGDKYAALVYDAMIYQCAKHAGAMAAALKGELRAIILTGGLAHDEYFTRKMSEYLGWIAEIAVMPGEFELEALAAGALRVLRGTEPEKEYTGVPVWTARDHMPGTPPPQ